jgi:hypothetical protein
LTNPTAVHASAVAHDTAVSVLDHRTRGFGVAITDHFAPFHRSASVT